MKLQNSQLFIFSRDGIYQAWIRVGDRDKSEASCSKPQKSNNDVAVFPSGNIEARSIGSAS
jgi:hypothetical protein